MEPSEADYTLHVSDDDNDSETHTMDDFARGQTVERDDAKDAEESKQREKFDESNGGVALEKFIRHPAHYEEYRVWRHPLPRQVWSSNGKNTAEQHRPATNSDLILDLVVVVVIANLGDAFKEYVKAPTGGDPYSFETVWPRVGMAFTVFINGFLLMYMRWQRHTLLINRWGQSDGAFELYWAVDVALFAVTGFSMVRGQEAPCFFLGWLDALAFALMDLNYIAMNLYCTIFYGRHSGQWKPLILFIQEAIIVLTVPIIALITTALKPNRMCNTEFCQTHESMAWGIGLFYVASLWDFLASSFASMTIVAIARSIKNPRCTNTFGSHYPLHTGNMVERVECLILM